MNELEKLTYDELEQISEILLKYIVAPEYCAMPENVAQLHPKILDFVKFLTKNRRWP